MCVSLPAKVVSMSARVAEVEINQLRRQVILAVDHVKVGDWVLIYGGAALAVLDEDAAQETIRLMEALRP